jgi:hypothetical protein
MTRALGGGRLMGKRLMRLVYMDEAGISNARDEPLAIVSAVIVDADKKLVQVERQLEKLVEKHIPAESRDGFIFHAKELFNGGGKVFKRNCPEWPLEKRLAIADDLAKIPKNFRLPLAIGHVDKKRFPQTFVPEKPLTASELALGVHVVAFMTCALQVDHWMRIEAKDEVCLLVIEDNADARKLIRETQNYNQNANIIASLDETAKKYLPFKKIKEDPLFSPKKPSSVLQLADFCAYVFKRVQMNPNDHRYLRFANPMRQQLVVLPWQRA